MKQLPLGNIAGFVWRCLLPLVAGAATSWAQTPTVPASTPAASQPTGDPDALSSEDAAVASKLDEHLHDLRFNAAPLSEVLDGVAKQSGLKIIVDWEALNAAGVAKDAPVTVRIHDAKLSKTLLLIFKSVEGEDDDHQLGYRVSKGLLTISSRGELNKLRVTRSYDLTDLLAGHPEATAPKTQATGMQGLPATEPESRADYLDELKKYITDNVDTNTWKDNGGNVGEINNGTTPNVISITQTPEAQRKVRMVLQSLRDAKVKAHTPTTAP
jgi:type II secretory pathway component GspD/PulD (secretin)